MMMLAMEIAVYIVNWDLKNQKGAFRSQNDDGVYENSSLYSEIGT